MLQAKLEPFDEPEAGLAQPDRPVPSFTDDTGSISPTQWAVGERLFERILILTRTAAAGQFPDRCSTSFCLIAMQAD